MLQVEWRQPIGVLLPLPLLLLLLLLYGWWRLLLV